VLVTTTGDGATTASYFVALASSSVTTGAYIMGFGRYLDELQRCPDDKWRIRLRHCHFEMSHYEATAEAS
jgi:hypothetical protein